MKRDQEELQPLKLPPATADEERSRRKPAVHHPNGANTFRNDDNVLRFQEYELLFTDLNQFLSSYIYLLHTIGDII